MLDHKKIKSNIVDVSFLNEELDDDVAQISMMITLFLKQSDKKTSELKDALEKKDFNEIKSVAHFLKSSFAIMGISSTDLLYDVEKLSAKNNDLEKIKNLCSIIFKSHEESVVEYKKILSNITTK